MTRPTGLVRTILDARELTPDERARRMTDDPEAIVVPVVRGNT